MKLPRAAPSFGLMCAIVASALAFSGGFRGVEATIEQMTEQRGYFGEEIQGANQRVIGWRCVGACQSGHPCCIPQPNFR